MLTSYAPAWSVLALVVDTSHTYTSELLDSPKVVF